MITKQVVENIRRKYQLLKPYLDARGRRQWAATEVGELGHGGLKAVTEATGLAKNTVLRGNRELLNLENNSPVESRVEQKDSATRDLVFLDALNEMMEPSPHDANTPFLWTCKSTRDLSQEFKHRKTPISHTTVSRLLTTGGYILQGSRRVSEWDSFSKWSDQFHYISKQVQIFHQAGLPVLSVVLGKVGENVSDDTVRYAIDNLRCWWNKKGELFFPQTKSILITVDGISSIYSINWKWEMGLKKWAREAGLDLYVCHFPPTPHKWNNVDYSIAYQITEKREHLMTLTVIGNPVPENERVVGQLPSMPINDQQMEGWNFVISHFVTV